MKNIKTVTLCIGLIFLSGACEKKDDIDPEFIREFNDQLEIVGAVKKKGNIPVPQEGSFGAAMEIITPSLEIEPDKEFQIDIATEEPGVVVFIQLDGIDDYFEIAYDDQNRAIGKIPGLRENFAEVSQGPAFSKTPNIRTIGCWYGHFSKPKPIKVKASAKVAVCMPPKKNGKPDMSQMHDKKFWSQPKTLYMNVNIRPGNCQDIQKKGDDLIKQMNAFLSNPSSSGCTSLKRSSLQLLEDIKECPGFTNDQYYRDALDIWRSIDCSDF